jgi:hypothetical protein
MADGNKSKLRSGICSALPYRSGKEDNGKCGISLGNWKGCEESRRARSGMNMNNWNHNSEINGEKGAICNE